MDIKKRDGIGGLNSGSNLFVSSGSVIQPTISYNSVAKTLTVGEGKYRTYLSTDFTGIMKQFTLSEAVLNVEYETKYYVCVVYNNGNPYMYLETDINATNDSNILVIYTVFVETTDADILNWGTEANGISNKLNERLIDTDRFGRSFGLELSSVTSALTSAGGEVYIGSNKLVFTECSSTTDECELMVKDGSGGWNITDVAVFPNTKYDDGSGTLATLTDGQYGVCWVWRSMGVDKELYIAMGGGSYSSVDIAKTSKIPSDLLERVQLGAVLIGRVIFLKGGTPAIVESAFDTVFNANSPTQHNSLLGLNGGTSGEYYHLTNAEHAVIQNTSNVNTGDETQATIFTKIGYTPLESNGIVAGTKTKIQYDTDGLVVSGTDATTADISDSLNRRYVTDAEHVNYNKMISVISSASKAVAYESANDTHTIATASGFVKLTLTLTAESVAGFTLANSRLTYSGVTKKFFFNATSTLLACTTNNTTISFKVYKNTTIPINSTLSIAKLDSATSKTTINAASGFLLNNGDFIEIFASVDKNCSFDTSALGLQITEDLGYSYNGL